MSESDQPIPVDPKDNSPEARHARQIANLKPPFQAGNTVGRNGRPRGRHNPMDTLKELWAVPPVYSWPDIQRMADGHDIVRRLWAREVLCAGSPRERWAIDRKGKSYPAGTDPEPGKAFERLLDRLAGKPRQTVKIESEPVRAAVDIRVDIAAMMVADPSMRAVVTAALAVDVAQLAAQPAVLEGSAQSAESSETGEIDGGGAPKSEARRGGGVTISQAANLDPKCSDIVRRPDA